MRAVMIALIATFSAGNVFAQATPISEQAAHAIAAHAPAAVGGEVLLEFPIYSIPANLGHE